MRVRKESILTSTLSNLFSSYTIVLLAMLTSIALNRGLGPELKGQYASLRLLFTFYAPLFLLGYPGGIMYYSLREQLDIRRFYLTGLITMFLTGVLASVLILACIRIGWFGDILNSLPSTVLYMSIGVTPLLFINAFCERVLYSFKLFRPSNKRNVIAAVLVFVGVFVLWWLDLLNLISATIVLSLSVLSLSIFNLVFIAGLFKIQLVIDSSRIFFPWKFGLKDFLNQVIAKSNDKFDQVFLGFLVSSSGFGIYSAGVALAGLVSSIPGSYTNVFFTQIASMSLDKGLDVYKRAMRVTLSLSILIAIAMALIARPMILILYGSAYQSAVAVVIFYLPGLIFQIAARLSIKFYAAQGKPLKNALVYTVALVASAPFYFILIPVWGLKGAAISSSIGYFAAFAFSMYQLKREFPFQLQEVLVLQKADIAEIKSQGRKLMAKFS